MTTKQLEKAIISYKKNGKIEPLTRAMRRQLVHLAKRAYIGFDLPFLASLKPLVENLESLDLTKKK